MLTAMHAARNVAGSAYDVWNVNVDAVYHEERRSPAVVGRSVPNQATPASEAELLGRAFARYDPVALGGALAVVLGAALFIATAALVVKGGEPLGPNLSLLGNYLLGFTVSWSGAWIALMEGGVGGLAFGYLLARLINLVIGWHEAALLRRVEWQMIDPVAGDGS